MSATIETFPSFHSLVTEYGLDNAIRRWNEHHHEKEAVHVEPWPNDEHKAIHQEVGRRLSAERSSPYSYERPDNRSYWVTPTGGRLHYIPGISEGRSAPIDPPSDELLLLTWQYKYWQTRADNTADAFADLKGRLEEAFANGHYNDAGKAKLKELHKAAKEFAAKAARIDEKRKPLLPRELREPTPEEAAIERENAEREDARRSRFKKELEQLELQLTNESANPIDPGAANEPWVSLAP